MADSRTERILDAIVAALDGASKPEELTVNRSRRQAVAPQDLPMLSVYPIRELVEAARPDRRAGVVSRTLLVRVRCRVQGEDETLDPLRQWVIAALASDLSLGGLALNVAEIEGAWAAADGSDSDYSACEMDFSIRYVTARGDLTSAA